MSFHLRNDICQGFNFKIETDFGRYLGIEISPNKLKKAHNFDLVEKTTNKIRGWQAKFLNMAGRATLIKSVLNSYPIYATQTNLLPISILNHLERNAKDYFGTK